MNRNQLSQKASKWNDLQVLARDAEQLGKVAEAAEHRSKATMIEHELNAARTDIRALVCP